MAHKVLIIIPAYNEEGNIRKTIEELTALKLSEDLAVEQFSFVVIDDGSSDKTFDAVKSVEGQVIRHPFNLGIGGAVQTGFKFAKRHGFDCAVQVDGDGQHDVRYLEDLIRPVLKGEADMSIGSRFLPPHLGYQSSFIRRIGINFFAHLISFLTDYKVTDPTSGFRAFNQRMINLFADYYPSDFPEPEAIAVASRYQAKVLEVSVQMRKRISGNSSIRYLKTLYYMVKVTFAVLLDKLKSKKGV